MTHTPPPKRPPRPTAEYRWTVPKAVAFLKALVLHGKVATAARSVGMTRQSAYRLRDRVPQVAEVWPRAQAAGRAYRLGKATISRPQGDGFHGQGTHSGPTVTVPPRKVTVLANLPLEPCHSVTPCHLGPGPGIRGDDGEMRSAIQAGRRADCAYGERKL